MEYKIQHDKRNKRFEAIEQEKVIGLIDYSLSENNKILIVTHTEVDPENEGKGIAGAMTKYMLDYMINNNLKIIPICSYTQTYITRHPEYGHLINL